VPRHYFILSSDRLRDVRHFTKAADIEIMAINTDAFRKSENVIDQTQDPQPAIWRCRFVAGS
jgi:type III restriction enzyme